MLLTLETSIRQRRLFQFHRYDKNVTFIFGGPLRRVLGTMRRLSRLVVLESGLGLESGLKSVFAGLGLGLGLGL